MVQTYQEDVERQAPKNALEGTISGKRSRGRPKKRWEDITQEDLKVIRQSFSSTDKVALKRKKWYISPELTLSLDWIHDEEEEKEEDGSIE